LVHNDKQHNDRSWQRDVHRLLKKLKEPSKTQTQFEETQPEEEKVVEPIFLSQTGKNQQQPTPIIQSEKSQQIQTTLIIHSEKSQRTRTTTIIQTDETGIQTHHSQNSSTMHTCCQDVSICPSVLVS
jgi:hypothetical protein